MAILTAQQLTELRQSYQTYNLQPTCVKTNINAAQQAVEDYFENSVKVPMAAAIEAAVPGVFSTAQKKALVKMWLYQKGARE